MDMNIGVDIIDNQRIKTKMKKNPRLISRILSSKEQVIFHNLKSDLRRVEYLASRFAAKEAIIKATNKQFLFQKIEILNSNSGTPEVIYNQQKVNNLKISIAHEQHYSVAFAILMEG